MKNFLTRCVQFLCFASLFYVANLIIWERFFPDPLSPNINFIKVSDGQMNFRIEEIPNYQNVDILILGSSHAYRGFDIRIFAEHGLSAFNLGSSAQTPMQTQVLLNRYLEELNPKLILYEVYPETFTSDGVESALDLLSSDDNDWLSIQMALKTSNIKAYNTLIYALLDDLFSIDRDSIENKTDDIDTYIEGGFVERELIYYNSNPEYKPHTWNLRDYQLAAFEDILSVLEEKDIDVVLIQAPITANRYNSYLNNGEIDAYFRGLGNYYNFNELISLSDHDHFYDSHHMNQSGVEIFDRTVLDILAADGFLDFEE